MELENFDDALEALIASGAENYGDGESMEALHQMQARFDSFVTEASAAFEVGEEWAADGAKTAATWLADAAVGWLVPPPSAGSAWAAPCATCPRWPRPGAQGAIGERPGPGHRHGPAPPHRGRHGP